MRLSALQTTLSALIRSTHQVSPTDDEYIRLVASSPHLAMVREVVLWWRAYGIERFCLLTATLLKRRGYFEAAISDFAQNVTVSPHVEALGESFLEYIRSHPDRLVATVAEFELALTRSKKGDSTVRSVSWEYDPDSVLSALLDPESSEVSAPRGSYRTIVSCAFPNLFHIEIVNPLP